jgi:hypothetical protein
MSILSTNHRLISIGESYSAGNGIDITDQVISVTGDATPYSAGENIDIQDHIISGKDWSQDITEASSHAYNETTAWVQENYANSADMTYISAVVDTKLDASAWSTVSSNYATEDYVIMADNITYNRATGYVDSQQFAKESACQSAFDYLNTNKLNTEDFTAWQNGQYATDIQTIEGQIANKYDTSSFAEVSGTFYTNDNPSGFITGVDLSPYYTTADANSLSSMLSGAIDYVSANADNVEVTNVVQSNSGVWSEVTNKLDATEFSNVSGSFYTNDNPSGFITGVDLSNYYTKDETSGKEELANAFANIPVGDPEVNAYVTSNSASIDESTNLVQSNSSTWNDVTAYQSNSASYITAHQSLEGLMSASLLESADGKWTAYNSIPFKAGDEFPASADEAIQAYQTNSSTYLTAHQSLDGLMSANLLEYSGSVITAYDGHKFAGEISGDPADTQVNQYVYDNSARINDVNTSYENNSGTFLTAHQSISADEWNSCYDDVNTNSGAWGGTPLPISARDGIDLEIDNGTLYIGASALTSDVANKLDTTAFSDVSATFLTGVDLSNYYTKSETSGADEIANAIASIPIGDPDVNAYVVGNSATIDDVVSTYQGASGTYLTAHQELTGYVPQSAFDELKQSYDALSSLFATYSGQWLLPNEGV